MADAASLDAMAHRHGLALVVQFGSTIAGPVHPESDVDIGVLLGRPQLSWAEEAELRADLQGLFPGREVDLVILDHADPLLLRRVSEGGRLLWGSPQRFGEWRMYAYRRYHDHRPYLALERAFVGRRLGEER